MKKLLYILIFTSLNVFAQLPNTDIWLLDFKQKKDSISLTNPVNITKRDGYDNQPCFSPDGSFLYFSSNRDGKQRDIYKYNLKNKKTTQVKNTATSEYSPTFMPDLKKLSVVMVEQDSAQRLWTINPQNGDTALFIDNIDSVGYHTWLENSAVFVFLLPEPFKLYLVDRKTGNKFFINDSIGRCFKLYSEMLLYVKKTNTKSNQLWLYNMAGQKSWPTKTIIEAEDFVILDNYIFWASGSKIYRSNIYKDERKLIADLSKYNITNITRITIGPYKNKMAISGEYK